MCRHGIIALVTTLLEARGAACHSGADTTTGSCGEAIKQAVNATLAVSHPVEEDLSFIYGTILTDLPEDPAHHSRNICIFANAEVDRSPTGTGVSARSASCKG
jgi:proline racemase